jgi:5'-deoxynucleotidase YfbR-like HD superfamily hydrolase
MEESMSRLKKKFTIAFQLSSVSRFSRDYMTKQENVLEHIGFCTFYSVLLAQELETVGVRLDYKKLLLSVAAHDLDESILGDIPRTTKYFNESVREEFKEIEEETIVCLDKWLSSNLLPHWKNAKNGLEGQILKVTDIAAVVYKNWAEIEFLGNRSFLRVCVETGEYLRSLDTSEYHPVLAAELQDIMDENDAILKNHEVLEADVLFLTLKKGK